MIIRPSPRRSKNHISGTSVFAQPEIQLTSAVLVADSAIQTIVFMLGLLFVFTLPWENVVIIPGIGTLARIAAAILVSAWSISAIKSGQFRPLNKYYIWLYLFLIWMMCTALWSRDITFSLPRLFTFAQLVFISYVCWNVFDRGAKILYALQAYILGAYVTVGILTFNFLSGNVTKWESRATLANSNENSIGLTLALGLPIAWYLATQLSKQKGLSNWLRVVNIAFVPLGLIGIMLTASRGSFLAATPFVLYALLSISQIKPKYRMPALLSILVLIFVAYYFTPTSAIDRIFTIQAQFEERDFNTRAGLWERGISAFLSSYSNFIIGFGIGSFPIIAGNDAHNTFVSILVETGIVGISLFSGILITVFASLLRFSWPEKLMWGTVALIWFLGNLSTTWIFYKPTWFFMTMLICHSNIGVSLKVELQKNYARASYDRRLPQNSRAGSQFQLKRFGA